MRTAARFCLPLVLLLLGSARAHAFELELGGGAKVDVAPYGIENVTILGMGASWVDQRENAQVGLIAAISAGPSKVDYELSACLRIWPAPNALAIFGGVGIVDDSSIDPSLVPLAICGLRFGTGALALVSSAEVHVKRGDTDTMFWVALAWMVR